MGVALHARTLSFVTSAYAEFAPQLESRRSVILSLSSNPRVGRRLHASLLASLVTMTMLAGCPDEDPTPTPDASTPDESEPRSDAGSPTNGPTDAGAVVDDASVSVDDAGAPVVEGVCDDATPHGCYSLNPATSADGCPAQVPEIRTLYPFDLRRWDRCSDRSVGWYAVCNYAGPVGERASCICDTGLHWICGYRR